MIPYFNTAGPCIEGEHYMLSPKKRFARIIRLIDEKKYFTVHAGRQTGKTTAARWLVDQYNQGDTYCALWVDIQTARDQPDIKTASREILASLERSIKLDLPDFERPDPDALTSPIGQKGSSPKPRPSRAKLSISSGVRASVFSSYLGHSGIKPWSKSNKQAYTEAVLQRKR